MAQILFSDTGLKFSLQAIDRYRFASIPKKKVYFCHKPKKKLKAKSNTVNS